MTYTNVTFTEWCSSDNSTHAAQTAAISKSDILALLFKAPVQMLRAIWAEQKKYNELVQLTQFDDSQLADIGVSRDDVALALRQPTARTAAYVLMHCQN